MDEHISFSLDNAPKEPGVYLWKDSRGKILYVGKAGSLRDRLRSYLNPQDLKTRRLVEVASKVETVVTKTETEALILEDALVKQNQPKYNVLLRDDKRYPYLRVTVKDAAPRIEVVRRVELDGSRYFGPYVDGQSVRKVLRMVGEYFGIRQCRHDIKRVDRPCIRYSMGKCSAPCGVIGRVDYADSVEKACRFLAGDQKGLVKELKARIKALSSEREFEKAIELRDLLLALESMSRKQDISSARLEDMDVLGYGFVGGKANITQLRVREHRVAAVLHYPLKGEFAFDHAESLKAFIKQHYTTSDLTPKLIVSSVEPSDKTMLEEILGSLVGSKVRIVCSSRGLKRKLADMAVKNSIHHLEEEALERKAPNPLELLRQVFRLGRPPERIEGYDISNLGPKNTVGAMVVFTKGRPDKSQYRRFAIRQEGQDDPRNMAETVQRRFQHLDWKIPDLVLLDGGKAQLAAVKGFVPPGVKVMALAKREEEVHLPDRRRPVVLAQDNPALHMLQAVRDEAHRFGRKYHTLKRSKEFIADS